MRERRALPALLLLLLVGSLAAPVDAATLIREAELPQLVAESRRAALVEVVDVRYGFDDRRLHSTWVTLQIGEALYGDDLPEAGGELTIKLYGAPQTMPDGSRLFIDGTPRYAPGQRWLLLLNADSRWGFTTAAGLYQGAFPIFDGVAGLRIAATDGSDRVLQKTGLRGNVAYAALRETILDEWTRQGGRVRAAAGGAR